MHFSLRRLDWIKKKIDYEHYIQIANFKIFQKINEFLLSFDYTEELSEFINEFKDLFKDSTYINNNIYLEEFRKSINSISFKHENFLFIEKLQNPLSTTRRLTIVNKFPKNQRGMVAN